METLPLIVWYLDDPVADPALVPLYFIAREARKHVKVVLSGEGADELFGGYTIYREPISLRGVRARCPAPCAARLGAAVDPAARGRARQGPAAPRLDRASRSATTATPASSADDEMRRSTGPTTRRCRYTDVTAPLYARPPHLDDSTRMQYVDLFTWLRGDILVKADKMTMANSLELRVPFLDTEVFAVGLAIPTDQKITKETTKYALRRALARDRAAARAATGAKLGFPVPIRHWLKDEMYDWARAIITESQADRDLIDTAGALRLLDAHRAGPHDYSPQDLDAAGVHDLARHLRRGTDPPGDPGAGLPGPALTGGCDRPHPRRSSRRSAVR